MFEWNLLIFLWLIVAGISLGFGLAIGAALARLITK